MPTSREGSCKPAPAAADIKNALAFPKVELCGEARQLGYLSLFKRVRFRKEIGALILSPWIEKRLEKLVSQIIVMRDIVAGTSGRVQMPEPCQYVAQSQCQSSRPVLLP